jgi:DNA-binding NarL/FixJ family response regulator
MEDKQAEPIRILMVEDDPDWTRAMSRFLSSEPDMLMVGAASNPSEAKKLASALDYDVVLMDIQLGEGLRDGIEVAADLLELRNAPVIMLTSVGDERSMTRAFGSGAVQYIEKTDYRELPAAIRQAVRQPAPMQALLKEFRRLKREEQLQPLTPAEREVFELIEQGRTQAEIGRSLFKSESTLKNQVNRILKKLGVRSSREAVRKVRRGDGSGGGGRDGSRDGSEAGSTAGSEAGRDDG